MKLLIASDIHGSAYWCQKLIDAVAIEKPDRLILLGDILYHGPRNDLPRGYNPKQVINLLNPLAASIIACRGNCEAEVDQMVLDFACMAEANSLIDPHTNKTIFLSHGHVWGPGLHNSVDRWPTLKQGDIFLYGHTHKKVNQQIKGHEGITVFNPGSTSLPKDDTNSYGIYKNGELTHVLF
ncbi:phosphodiesterase [Atopobium fossor]|uniref:phosphodiesterase n=1 Tax=Atopobium fossor TaxID=39487 RepID=UPI000408653F|nr:phosphodiesterase [Atopobium fossor]